MKFYPVIILDPAYERSSRSKAEIERHSVDGFQSIIRPIFEKGETKTDRSFFVLWALKVESAWRAKIVRASA